MVDVVWTHGGCNVEKKMVTRPSDMTEDNQQTWSSGNHSRDNPMRAVGMYIA